MLPLVPVDAAPTLPELRQRADLFSAQLNPGPRSWIERQGREEANYPHFDEGRVRQAVTRRFQAQAEELGAGGAEALVLLVLKTAADATEHELREAMESLRYANEQKQASHEAMSLYLETRALLKEPPPERAHLRVVPPVSQERLAELDEMAESASLKLQMATHRRSKVVSALYAVMKKLPVVPEAALHRLK